MDPNYNYSVTNIIGIRSSFIELDVRRCGITAERRLSIGKTFIDAIYDWTITVNVNTTYKFLRVLHPIGVMPTILERYGFVNPGQLVVNNSHIMGKDIVYGVNWMESDDSIDFRYFDDVGSRFFDKYLFVQ